MVKISYINFGQVRKTALAQWIHGTGRSLKPITTIPGAILIDDFENGKFECQWQNNARQTKGINDWHVPHFCSLGDWASNITDILTDFRFDTTPVGFGFPEHEQALFRYYTRFILVFSELITDFNDLLQEMLSIKDEDDSREMLSSKTNPQEIHQLYEYINSLYKHKTAKNKRLTKLHECNHHLSFFFEDSGRKCTFKRSIRIGKSKVNKPDSIIVPKLGYMIGVILNGYQVIDKTIHDKPTEFNTFITKPHSTTL